MKNGDKFFHRFAICKNCETMYSAKRCEEGGGCTNCREHEGTIVNQKLTFEKDVKSRYES